MPITEIEQGKGTYLGQRETKRPVLDIKSEMLTAHQMEICQRLDKY